MNARPELPSGVSRVVREGPRPAIGHMPFEGHRTVAEVWEEEARRESAKESAAVRKAREYGFDPASLGRSK